MSLKTQHRTIQQAQSFNDIKICYHSRMNASHHKTLLAIYATPTPATLEWRKVESLFVSLGAQLIEGNGSRVRFELNDVVATFHRPHPQKEAKPYQVRDTKEFLTQLGVKP